MWNRSKSQCGGTKRGKVLFSRLSAEFSYRSQIMKWKVLKPGKAFSLSSFDGAYSVCVCTSMFQASFARLQLLEFN